MIKTKASRLLAQKIVDAVHEVTSCPINFIDPTGIILASTNESRIGEFHEAGYDAIKKLEPTIVDQKNIYKGSLPGVNYPISVEQEPFGVIGISGTPNEVSKYGFLSTKVSEIFIKEQQLRKQNESSKQKMDYFIRSYIYNDIDDTSYLQQLQEAFDVSSNTHYSVLLIKPNDRYNLQNIAMVEKRIKSIFLDLGMKIHTYIYPNEFIGLVKTKKRELVRQALEDLVAETAYTVIAGLGSTATLHSLHTSYDHAKLALKAASDSGNGYAFYDDLQLEVIFGQLPSKAKENFALRILHGLDEQEREILRYYFDNGANLKETAAHFFIHGNTLQYKLDRIAEKTQLNPRIFKEASVLYFALLIDK